MRKLFLNIIGLLLAFSAVAYAQEQPNMRAMAVAQLYEYGEAVYERGDYNQAAKVFSRILKMDPQHSGAYDYAQRLNKQGQSIALPEQRPMITVTKIEAPKQNFTPYKPEVITTVVSQTTGSNDDLKTNIQLADQSIEQLKKDIGDLHAQIEQGKSDLHINN